MILCDTCFKKITEGEVCKVYPCVEVCGKCRDEFNKRVDELVLSMKSSHNIKDVAGLTPDQTAKVKAYYKGDQP